LSIRTTQIFDILKDLEHIFIPTLCSRPVLREQDVNMYSASSVSLLYRPHH